MQGCNMFVNVYNLNKIIYKGGKKIMRKIEELKNELKKYFRDIDVFYDLEDGQVTDVLLVLRKDNVVYNAEFADDIFRFSPGVVLNHLIRAIDYGTLKSRLVSLEEDQFEWLNNNEEDREISAFVDCIQKYLQ